ncbi:MAG: hypothetical protein B9S32_15495 [Verrucomicrobia bacterium Tous-C9LFEB]|nr:MAG: hypothetical protein B9S32_15495 [Verrucomicrobia bacterium Tous-C9LFEB]
MNPQLQLESASGYLFLGMADECLEELKDVDFLTCRSERYMVLRLAALVTKREWLEALIASRMLKARYPECELAYVSGATCLIELGRCLEAVELLLDGPVSMRHKAMTHLQIAYCEFQMGNDFAGRYALEEARMLDPELVAEAEGYIQSEIPPMENSECIEN